MLDVVSCFCFTHPLANAAYQTPSTQNQVVLDKTITQKINRDEIADLTVKPSCLAEVAWQESDLTYDPLEPLLG